MKKIFVVFALMAMLMLPLTSFSMTAMEEGDLSSVTGQAGVSINLDVRVDLVADTLAWGDADGFVAPNVSVTGNEGWVGLSGLEVSNLRIRADQMMLEAKWFSNNGGAALAAALQTEASTFIPAYNAAFPATPCATVACVLADAAHASTLPGWAAFYGAYVAFAPLAPYAESASRMQAELIGGTYTPFAPLTIDVATDGTHGPGITFVRIGTGSLQIEMDSMIADVELGPASGFPGAPVSGTPDLKYQLGSLYLGDLALRIGGNSYIDIFNARPAGEQGVSIDANVTIKDFNIGTLAWGDKDGIDWAFTTGTTGIPGTHTTDADLQTPIATAEQGWVGLKDLSISRIDIAGQIDIDVATDSTGWTFVQIGLGTDAATGLNVQLSGLNATAALGAAPTTLDQELGAIYMSGVDVTVYGALQLGARADGTQGVTIDLQQISVDISDDLVVSWGDLDGLTGVTDAAGYVGLVGLNINGLSLQGKVTIDVATIDDAAEDTATTIQDMMYLGYRENNLSPTIVHIGLGSGDASQDTLDAAASFINDALGITISSLSGNVAFDSVANLATPNIMGMLYVGTIKVGVNGWVDIAAH